MADPLAPLHKLADTGDLTHLPTEALYARDKELNDVLKQLPAIQKAIGAARQAIAAELHRNRELSFRTMAKGYGLSPTRITQILAGDTANSTRRRNRTQQDDDEHP